MKTFVQVVELLHGFHMLTDEQATYMINEATAILGLIRG